jgi:hypothetical protein
MPTKNESYPLDIVFRLINSELEEEISPNDYDVSLPLFSLGPVNTKIVLTPLNKTNLYGKFEFYYNRLQLSELGTLVVTKNQESSLGELLTQINDKSMFYISTRNIGGSEYSEEIGTIVASEIVNKPIPPFGSSVTTYMNMIAVNNSYILTGHTSVRINKG